MSLQLHAPTLELVHEHLHDEIAVEDAIISSVGQQWGVERQAVARAAGAEVEGRRAAQSGAAISGAAGSARLRAATSAAAGPGDDLRQQGLPTPVPRLERLVDQTFHTDGRYVLLLEKPVHGRRVSINDVGKLLVENQSSRFLIVRLDKAMGHQVAQELAAFFRLGQEPEHHDPRQNEEQLCVALLAHGGQGRLQAAGVADRPHEVASQRQHGCGPQVAPSDLPRLGPSRHYGDQAGVVAEMRVHRVHPLRHLLQVGANGLKSLNATF
mmetsp:Transcript_57222/g.166013  ORF Transcript_57222/g.166013 Transcript_57222/m.166013 type:complete len:268 (-) Transcript_57222:758-1561(-)